MKQPYCVEEEMRPMVFGVEAAIHSFSAITSSFIEEGLWFPLKQTNHYYLKFFKKIN